MSDAVQLGLIGLGVALVGIIVPVLTLLLKKTTAIATAVNGAHTKQLEEISALKAKVLELMQYNMDLNQANRRAETPTHVKVSDTGEVTVEKPVI